MAVKKERLDKYLAEHGYSLSREKAKREIIAGWVKVNGETIRNPSAMISDEIVVSIERPGGIFVSRGGEKLNKGLDLFGLSVEGRITADFGASTGGFTDCMLKRGASKVYAVDVGYNQLDYSLRIDERVVVMERRHVNSLEEKDFAEPIDFIAADLSFISILRVAEKIIELFTPVEGVFLIKPQFEAESGEQKKGVVRKPEIHIQILVRVLEGLKDKGFCIKGLSHSPIKGPKGNIEFLLHFLLMQNAGNDSINTETMVKEAVEKAHKDFGDKDE